MIESNRQETVSHNRKCRTRQQTDQEAMSFSVDVYFLTKLILWLNIFIIYQAVL